MTSAAMALSASNSQRLSRAVVGVVGVFDQSNGIAEVLLHRREHGLRAVEDQAGKGAHPGLEQTGLAEGLVGDPDHGPRIAVQQALAAAGGRLA